MKIFEVEADGQYTITFPENFLYSSKKASLFHNAGENSKTQIESNGGILRNGEWVWIAHGKKLKILSLHNNQIISMYEFSESLGYEQNCNVKSVEELFPDDNENALLCVLIENVESSTKGNYLCICSVISSNVLSTIDLPLRGTCIKFIGPKACRRNILQNFDGCIAVGTLEGVLLLVDLNVKMLTTDNPLLNTFVPSQIVDCNLALTEIHRTFRNCQQDGIHFILKMDVIQKPSKICCILPVDEAMSLAIGLVDGRLIYYDLIELQIIHVAPPTLNVVKHSLVHMTYMTDNNTVKPCIYLWAIYENCNNLYVVMHVLHYMTWKINTSGIFETFDKCSIGFQMQLDVASAYISCQALRLTLPCNLESGVQNLCVFSWFSHNEGKNKILMFDLTMYCRENNVTEVNCKKNDLPGVIDNIDSSYISNYILNGSCKGYDIWFNPDTLAPFISCKSSIEGYLYPNSISFDCYMLYRDGCRRYNWEGAQNYFINILKSSNASIFLEYKTYYDSIVEIGLHNPKKMPSNTAENRTLQYEVILTTALEYNCISLLHDCAKSWTDGSFMANLTYPTDLALSTLTNWAWKYFKKIKQSCDCIKAIVLDCDDFTVLDQYSHEKLLFNSRQMELLAELYQKILINSMYQIPERVFLHLKQQKQQMFSEAKYYNLFLWLINIGLLPQLSTQNILASSTNINVSKRRVIYPYIELCSFYKRKRDNFRNICSNFIVQKTGHCRLLYIDYLLEYQCKIQSSNLYNYWYKGKGEPIYPPSSIQSIMDIMHVPDIAEDIKYAVLLYFLLDLNMVIDDTQYKDVLANLIKFPSVFKLSPHLIKTVQSFWNLDRGHLLLAIDEFISPFNMNQKYERWQIELLLEVLLAQKANNVALRLLETQAHLITPELKLKTLLDNGLISESFHFVRSRNDKKLLEYFFTFSINHGKFSVIRDLALTETESFVLLHVLKNKQFPGTESLHFIYLLQKSKYLDAVTYLDDLSKVKTLRSLSLPNKYNEMETPNLVLSAFKTTLIPITQNLINVYFKIKNKIKQKELNDNIPVPLSCQLIKQNANSLLGGIYHSSALSTHLATYYGDITGNSDDKNDMNDVMQFTNSSNAPFLRPLQTVFTSDFKAFSENIKYPTMFNKPEKRTFEQSEVCETNYEDINNRKSMVENLPKRRRVINSYIFEDTQNSVKNTYPFEKKGKEINQKKNNWEIGEYSKECLDFELPINDDNNKTLKDSVGEFSNLSNKRHIFKDENLGLKPQETLTEPNDYNKYYDHQLVNNLNKFECKSDLTSKSNSPVASDDKFYSSIPSLNSSTMTVVPYKNKIDLSEVTKQTLLSGPKARKPLSRLFVERDESLKSNPQAHQYLVNPDTTQFAQSNDSNEQQSELSKTNHSKEEASTEGMHNILSDELKKGYYKYTKISSASDAKISIQAASSLFSNNSLHSYKQISSNMKLNEFELKNSSSTVCETSSNVNITSKIQTPNCTTIANSGTAAIDTSNESNEVKSTIQLYDTVFSVSACTATTLETSSMIYTCSEQSTKSGSKNEECFNSVSQSIERRRKKESNTNAKNAKHIEKIQDEMDLLYGDLYSLGSDENATIYNIDKEMIVGNIRNFKNMNESENKREDICTGFSPNSSSLSSVDGTLATSITQEVHSEILLHNENSYVDDEDGGSNDHKNYDTVTCSNIDDMDDKHDNNIDVDYSDNDDIYSTNDTNIMEVEINPDSSSKDEVELNQNIMLNREGTLSDQLEETSLKIHDIEKFTNTFAMNAQRVLDETTVEIEGKKVVNESVTHHENTVKVVDVEGKVLQCNLSGECMNNTPAANNIIKTLVEDLMSKNVDSKFLEEEITVPTVGEEINSKIGIPKKSEEILGECTKKLNVEVPLLLEAQGVKVKIEETNSEIECIQQHCKEVEANQQKSEFVKVDNVRRDQRSCRLKSNVEEKKEGKQNLELIDGNCIIATKTNELNSTKMGLTNDQKSDLILSSNTLLKKNVESLNQSQSISTPSKRYFLRGCSEPPGLCNTLVNSEIMQRQYKRYDSVPPQSQTNMIEVTLTEVPISQLQRKIDDVTTASSTASLVSGKVCKRRRSNTLEGIVKDSPSFRTRSRLRLNSIESEIGSLDQQPSKSPRNREITQTPQKRQRRRTISGNVGIVDTSTVLNVTTENKCVENVLSTSTSKNKRRSSLKRKNSVDETSENNEYFPSLFAAKTESNLLYSSGRRLTRSQLALLEKSNLLAQNLHLNTETSITPPNSLRGVPKSYSLRSAGSSRNESDDNESISSRQSKTSNTSLIRRVTRNSVKHKNEIDDDSFSVASSIGSERTFRSARYKSKLSPNATLSSIPEDSIDETTQENRRLGNRKAKKQ